MFKGCLAYIEPRAYVICSLLIHLSRARVRDFLFSEIMKGTGGREDGGPGGGGGGGRSEIFFEFFDI